MTIDYAARARALVGAPFRPQARGEGGFDCVGLIIETYALGADSIRRNYQLRGEYLPEIHEALSNGFRRVPPKSLRSGDVMVLQSAARQLHLAVRTDDGMVHAHAGIRRVVETPGMPEWPLTAVYRKRRR